MASSASWIWCFVLVVSSIGSIASASEEKEFVLALDHSNFSDVVSKNDFVVVEFYAPWCGHCKNLAPEYEKAASILNRHDSKVVLAKVDANEEANKDLASQYDVQGFPTLKILRNGGKDIQDYKGPREADGIVEYLKKQSGPASAEIKSDEDAGALIDEKKVVVVGVFPKFSGEEFENFITVAEILRSEYDFGHTKDAKLLPRGESSVTGPVVRLFKPFDELVVDSKDFGVDALEKFVAASSVPTVTIFNIDPNNHPFVIKFFNSQDAKAMLFMNFSDGIHESFKSKYHEVAKQYKGEGISFLMGDLDASKGAFQDFKEGKVEPFKKSEPIPEVNSEPVKVVVGDSIQDMVFNSGKNVLLEFYAPWCGHCKNLAPILEEVALSFQDDADVLIAKLDATANDYPTDVFDVKGYPTMYFRSSNGNIVSYDGDRSKEAIIDFVNQHRSGGSTAQQESEAEHAKDEL